MRAYVIYSTEFDLTIGGSSLADSINSYCLRSEKPWTTKEDFYSPSSWGDVYCLGGLSDFCKAPKVNWCFFRLLDKLVSSCCYIALSLDDTAKRETCIRGQIESQSSSLRAFVTILEYLKDTNCVPDDAIFCQLVASMTTALNSQSTASFFPRRPFCNRLGVSPLCCISRASVKHMLLSTPSSLSSFNEEVIRSLLTQVKDDS